MQHIEKSAFKKGVYVACSNGVLWHITSQRNKQGVAYRWDAIPSNGGDMVSAPNLKTLDKTLGM